jgi:hypothetical protein
MTALPLPADILPSCLGPGSENQFIGRRQIVLVLCGLALACVACGLTPI